LQTVANLQTYDMCERSCLQGICTASDCWSCKPLSHGGLQNNNICYATIR